MMQPLLLLTVVVAFGLAGCGPLPLNGGGVSEAQRQAFSDYHTRAAASTERQGDLHQALLHWRILAVAEPKNRQLRAAIERLQREIERRTRAGLRRGREAVRQGRLKQAQSEFLAVLVLDPDHVDSMAQLRKLVRMKMQQQESVKAIEPTGYAVDDPADSRAGEAQSEAQSEAASEAASEVESEVESEAGHGRAHGLAGNSSAPPPTSPAPNATARPVEQGTAVAAAPEPSPQSSAPRPDLQRFRRLHQSGSQRALIDAVAAAKFTAAIPASLQDWLLQAYLAVAESLRSTDQLPASLALIDGAQLYAGTDPRNRAFSRTVRRRFAVGLYAQGKERLQDDIDGAIRLWEQALVVDPQYSEVRFQLQKAYRVRERQRYLESSP